MQQSRFESERVFQEIKSKLDSSDKIKFFENIKLKNIEEDEIDLGIEDLTKIRKHKSIERCPKIIRQVKNVLGYICQVCLINLEEKYGAIGKEYIEAHHLKPVHLNKGTQQKRNVSDFAVLCPNCHRTLHHGIKEEREILLDIIYNLRSERLDKIGIKLDKESLFNTYDK